MPAARRILSLWFPRLAAERALRRLRPAEPVPLAVVADVRGMQRLASLSGGAEAAGLWRGQPLRDAQAICPELLTRPADAAAEAGFLTALRRWLGAVSPWVAEAPPDGLMADLTGCAHLFGGEAAVLARLRAEAAAMGLTLRGAIADTPGAAWALARFAPGAAVPGLGGDAIRMEARATRARAAGRPAGRAGAPRAVVADAEGEDAGAGSAAARRAPGPAPASGDAAPAAAPAAAVVGGARGRSEASGRAKGERAQGGRAQGERGAAGKVAAAKARVDGAREAGRAAAAVAGQPVAGDATGAAGQPAEAGAASAGSGMSSESGSGVGSGVAVGCGAGAGPGVGAGVGAAVGAGAGSGGEAGSGAGSGPRSGVGAASEGLAQAPGPGLCIVAPGGVEAALAPLPPQALRLSDEVCAELARLGLRRIGELMALPRAALARRFDRLVLLRLDQALGRDPEPLSPAAPPRRFAVRMALPEAIGLEADLLAALDRMLPRLCARLAEAGRGARRLRLQAFRVDGGVAELTVGLARPGHDLARMRPLLALKLGGIDAGFGIDMVRLEAVETEPLGPAPHPGPLAGADGPGAAATAALEDLIGRLGARLGMEAVLRLRPADSHIPEKAVQRHLAAHAPPAPQGWAAAGVRETGWFPRTGPRPGGPERGGAGWGGPEWGGPEWGGPEWGGPEWGGLARGEPVQGSAGGARPGGPGSAWAGSAAAGAVGARATGAGEAGAGEAGWSRPSRHPRPLLLLDRPEPLQGAEGPELPSRFRWRRRELHRTGATGPERIAPEWWLDDPDWRSGQRDYWRVETDTGLRLWLFYAHGGEMPGGWFCHGLFD